MNTKNYILCGPKIQNIENMLDQNNEQINPNLFNGNADQTKFAAANLCVSGRYIFRPLLLLSWAGWAVH